MALENEPGATQRGEVANGDLRGEALESVLVALDDQLLEGPSFVREASKSRSETVP